MISIENFDLASSNKPSTTSHRTTKTSSSSAAASSPYFMDLNKPTSRNAAHHHHNNNSNNVDKAMGLLKINGAGNGSGSGSGNSEPFEARNNFHHSKQHQLAYNNSNNGGAKVNQYKPVILMKAKMAAAPVDQPAVAVNRNSASSEQQPRPGIVLATKPTVSLSPNSPLLESTAVLVNKSNSNGGMVMSRSFAGPLAGSQTSSSSPVYHNSQLSASQSPKTPAQPPFSVSSKPSQRESTVVKPTVVLAPQPQSQPPPQVAPSVPLTAEVVGARVSTAPFMTTPVKLLDDNLIWQDGGGLQEFLLDQPDFLVVGVLGKERTGKSTLMSWLAGCSSSKHDGLLFNKQTSSSSSSTSGIQAFVTSERTILLDVQPLLSSAILDKTISQDKKQQQQQYASNEQPKLYENHVELQSIELACFVLSVCNVVILTEDWFTDPNLFRLIKTAEMLTPSYPGPGPTTTNQSDLDFNLAEHRPHLVYVLNKCGAAYTSLHELREMKETVRFMARGSKLIHRGSLNPNVQLRSHIRDRQGPTSRSSTVHDKENINMLVIPKQQQQAETNKPAEGMLADVAGTPSFERSVTTFTNQILAIKRTAGAGQVASSNLFGAPNFTEKKWFAFAAKMWDLIRKSAAINEYNRLMT